MNPRPTSEFFTGKLELVLDINGECLPCCVNPDMNTRITYTLELASREHFKPKEGRLDELEIREVVEPCPEFNKFLHRVVGAAHCWGGHDGWGRTEWTEYVERPTLETWVGYFHGAPAGYFELEKLPDGAVRILTFGLLPRFIGRGIGGHLLTAAVRRGWELDATYIWLRTNTQDHPHALPNYQARGFQVAKKEEGPLRAPEFPPGTDAAFV